jgi:predicted dehydrogenase
MNRIPVAVIGAGQFGQNHMRVLSQSPHAELRYVVDSDESKAIAAALHYGCEPLTGVSELGGKIRAAIVAVPTTSHAEVSCALLERGIDVLVEKPIAPDLESGRRIVEAAVANQRILQVGHLERFNPAVMALQDVVTTPLFFEIHRLSVFTPRSLDVDVVLDLMIHDIDIVLALTRKLPEEIRAAGISILSDKVDIANVRLAFSGGCIANLTASRVSTERVRKVRLFQPHEYISVDYAKQEAFALSVSGAGQIGFKPLAPGKDEPLRLEVEAFLSCVDQRTEPRVGGQDALAALEVAHGILAKIEEHAKLVAQSLSSPK